MNKSDEASFIRRLSLAVFWRILVFVFLFSMIGNTLYWFILAENNWLDFGRQNIFATEFLVHLPVAILASYIIARGLMKSRFSGYRLVPVKRTEETASEF